MRPAPKWTADDMAGDDTFGGGEQHGDEQQTAAQEDGREEAVLPLSEPVPHHADAPQEGDAGERHEDNATLSAVRRGDSIVAPAATAGNARASRRRTAWGSLVCAATA